MKIHIGKILYRGVDRFVVVAKRETKNARRATTEIYWRLEILQGDGVAYKEFVLWRKMKSGIYSDGDVKHAFREFPPDQWGDPVERDLSDIIKLRNERGVTAFFEFPLETQKIYKRVAKCFPHSQVWAVGSRVRGDFARQDDSDFIKQARAKAGMKPKEFSDFDFIVSADAEQVGELPYNTERVKCRVPENEMIPIPIYNP